MLVSNLHGAFPHLFKMFDAQHAVEPPGPLSQLAAPQNSPQDKAQQTDIDGCAIPP